MNGPRTRRALLAAIMGLLFIAGSSLYAWAGGPGLLAAPLQVKHRRPAYDTGSITVRFKPGVAAARMDGVTRALGCRIARPDRYVPGLCTVALPARSTVASMVAAFKARLDVQYAEPTYYDWIQMVPNDPLYPQQWNFPMIHMPEAWDLEPGGKQSTIVAIIDTGVAYESFSDPSGTFIEAPDLVGLNFVSPHDFVNNDDHPNDDEGHGTHVCGTVAQQTNNGVGVAGIAYNVSVMPVKTLDASGGGTHQGFSDGVHWAVDNGAKVINYSAGGSDSQTKHDAVIYAYQNNVLLVAAYGNDGMDNPPTNYPGRYPEALGVGAVGPTKALAYYSNWGDGVDVVAPGGDQSQRESDGILQNTFDTSPLNMGYFFFQGTSMATPHVTGLAALLVSQGAYPTWQSLYDQITKTTEDLGTVGYDTTFGWGLINAQAALQAGAAPHAPKPATSVAAGDTPGDEGGSITVTWKRSADDGGGYDDVVGYEVWRGPSSDPSATPFSMLAGTSKLPKGTTLYIDTNNVTNGTNYYYYVVTRNATLSSTSTVAGPAVARDDLAPPVVDHLVAHDTPGDNGRSISLSWSGYKGTSDLATFRVYRSKATFTDVTAKGVTLVATLNDSNQRSYQDKAANPKDKTSPPVDQTDYWYAVTAADKVGNVTTGVEATGPVQSAPNLSITFESGLRMITIPAAPLDPAPMAVFEITDPKALELARYDPTTGAYLTLAAAPDDSALNIAPGLGFWLNRSIASVITVGGNYVKTAKAEVALSQGWNMVGSPYDADYPFTGIKVRDTLGTEEYITRSNHVRKYGWRYDASEAAYKLVSPILPHGQEKLPAREAMWIYAFESGLKLVFADNSTTTAVAPTAEPVQLDGWQIELVARAGGTADTANYLGICSAAKEIGPVVSPPPLRGGVDLYFTSGGARDSRLAMDFRSALTAETEWQFVVASPTAKTQVEVSWPDLSPVPTSVRPLLTDLATGHSVYMRTCARYRYQARSAGEQRRFKITLASAAAGPVMAQLVVTSSKAGGAELSYVLNRATARVQIEVLNAAGRLVAALAPTEATAGRNRAVWNGLSTSGQRVPGGRYLVRVMAVADDDGEAITALGAVTLGN